MTDHKNILVYCETLNGRLSPITLELLGAAAKLSKEINQEVNSVLIGNNIKNLAQEAISFGASKVSVIDDPLLNEYQSESYLSIIEKVVRELNPEIVLLGQTQIGRELAPRLAFRLHTAVTLDCVSLKIDPDTGSLLRTKPIYGGNVYAVYQFDAYPQMATLRAKSFPVLPPDAKRTGEVVIVPVALDPSKIKVKVLERSIEALDSIKLEEAKVVVCGGRGIGGPEGFKQLEELARLLKGAYGGSRPPCDNHWISDNLQIGLTGKLVSPELYFAIGVSGSSQHLSGCSGSKVIVAINKDPEANIFKVAHYGIVGDWKKVVPAFTEKVKQLG